MVSSEVEILTVKEEEEDTDEADANAPCEDDCAAVQNWFILLSSSPADSPVFKLLPVFNLGGGPTPLP